MSSKLLLEAVCCILIAFSGWKIFNDMQPAEPPPFHQWAEEIRLQEPQVGSSAPDFSLSTLDGEQDVRLSELTGGKPTVLIFGSYTCPYFREHSEAINQLYADYGDQADFLFIYVREAHPVDEGAIPQNLNLSKVFSAKTLQQRQQTASMCRSSLKFEMTTLVDDLQNSVSEHYNAWPERAYVLDGRGRITHKSAGPGSLDCRAIEKELTSLLATANP